MSALISAADRFAIEDLFALYHWALDTADVEGFADTFVEDGVVLLETSRKTERFEGRTGLIDLAEGLRAWSPFPGCQHYSGQLQIDADGPDRVHVRSFTFVAECRGEPPYLLRYAGRRDDRVVRRGGRWLFEQRLVRLWQGDALRNLNLASLVNPARGPMETTT